VSYFLRPSWNSGGSFAPRTPPADATTHGAGYWHGGRMTFVRSLPLVAHDDCTAHAGTGGHPSDAGRDAFSALAGADWCWWPGSYSDDPATAPACFYCGESTTTANRAELIA